MKNLAFCMSHWRAIFDSRSPMCKNVPLGTGKKKASTTKTTPTYICRPEKKRHENKWTEKTTRKQWQQQNKQEILSSHA